MRKINFGQKLLDSRWKPSDQLIQLKGLVEFDERYRYWIGLKDEIKTEEREKEIKKFAENVKRLRSLLQKYNASEIESIDKVLKQDREIFLKCRGKEPQDIIEDLKQMVLRKKLAVDKSFYEVKKKEKELYDIQGQITLAKEKMSQEEQIVRNKDIEEREKYSAALEYAKTQKDVCRITLDSYNKLLGILKNDARYFDDLLAMLKEDALVQSTSILKMMTLGQMLSEDFSWLKTEAKKHAITFNADTKDTRLSIKKINSDMKQLEKINTKLREYAAFSYPLFQEETKEPVLSDEEKGLRTVLTELEDFTDKWKSCLNAEEEKDFFPKLFKVFRINGDLLKRMDNLKTQKDFQEETSNKLELVNAELDNYLDDYVRKDLAEMINIENEMDTIAEEMYTLKIEEDKINEDMDFYKNIIYQLKRLLRHVNIGPPFGDGIEAENDLVAINKIRHENPAFHLDTESEDEDVEKPGNMEDIARSYLDPNVTFDMKSAFKYETEIIKEENIIQIFDNVMMQMKTLYEVLTPEVMSQDPTEEELLSLGNFYADIQAETDSIIEECLEKEKIIYKHFKPKYDDFHKKNCSNKSRLEIKIENQIMVFENEGPTVGVILSKGALHPPGVIRGMYVPETDSEEEEENEDAKKEEKEEAKGSDEDDLDYLNEDNATISSGEDELDSDLNPDEPKPHICF